MAKFIQRAHLTSITEFRICRVLKEHQEAVQRAIDRGDRFAYSDLQQIQDRRLLNKYIDMENRCNITRSKIFIPEDHSETALQKYEEAIKGTNLIAMPLIITFKKQETKKYR